MDDFRGFAQANALKAARDHRRYGDVLPQPALGGQPIPMERDTKQRLIPRAGTALAMAGAMWLFVGCGGGETDSNSAERKTTLGAAIPVSPVDPDNMVSYWDTVAAATVNAKASASDATESERIPFYAFDMTSVHLAMYDAAMAIAGTHKPYLEATRAAPAPGTSIDAAVAAAAYGVLKGLFPNRSALYQTAYIEALAKIANGSAKDQGIALGTEVAQAIVAARANDGRATKLPDFVDGTQPGQFRNAPPPPVPIGRYYQYVKPFGIKSASQFRAGGPPALDSDTYTADFNETRDLGGATSTTRTLEQTEAARFHTEPPPLFWTRNLHQFAASQTTLAENARLMALLYVVQADATIGCFESKYHYFSWRPKSAIRLADTDGNPATIADPSWLPIVSTPNHPEYPAAHACVFSATGEALRSFYGTKKISFSFDTMAGGIGEEGKVHRYDSTDDLLDDSVARIWGGMHFRTSIVHGGVLGMKTAKWVVKHHFEAR